jgi:DNA-binding NtrC family response regulator
VALLAILQPDVGAAARISTALGAAHDVVACASWRALRASMKKGQVDGCIVDARHPSRDGARQELSALREQYPILAIVAHVDVSK